MKITTQKSLEIINSSRNELQENGHIKIHNNFKAQIFGPDGSKKDEYLAENIVLDRTWNAILNSNGSRTYRFMGVKIGTGSPPGDSMDPSRTTLYETLGSFIVGTDRKVSSLLENNIRTTTLNFKCSIPANATYVGNITEIGCFSDSSNMVSHALFRDSEGQPISINKGENDTLIINVTVYVTVSYDNSVIPTRSQDIFTREITTDSSASGPSNWTAMALTALPLDYNPNLPNRSSGLCGVALLSSNATVDKNNRKINFPKTRHGVETKNNGFANYMNISGLGVVKLPNSNFFPNYTATAEVGMGDGVKTVFKCPFPEFIQNTDVISVNGVNLTRGVDYTLSHKNNSLKLASSAESSKHSFIKIEATQDREAFLSYENQDNSTIRYLNPVTFAGIYIPERNTPSDLAELKYSNDGENWTTAISVNISQANNRNKWHGFKSPITATFWRLETNFGYAFKIADNPVWLGDEPTEGIIFTNPPAANSEIKITCELDRPFKSSEFVFDTTFELNY